MWHVLFADSQQPRLPINYLSFWPISPNATRLGESAPAEPEAEAEAETETLGPMLGAF